MFYICNEMKRVIFNPQHDMCLADGRGSFIPPAAILEFACKCAWVERFMCGGESGGECGACEDGGLQVEGEQGAVTSIVPWGWNRCLKESLIKEGVPRELLPDPHRR